MSTGLPSVNEVVSRIAAGIAAADNEAAASRAAFQAGPEVYQAFFDKKYSTILKAWEDEFYGDGKDTRTTGAGAADVRPDTTVENPRASEASRVESNHDANPGILWGDTAIRASAGSTS